MDCRFLLGLLDVVVTTKTNKKWYFWTQKHFQLLDLRFITIREMLSLFVVLSIVVE